jgi:hypothetical protein
LNIRALPERQDPAAATIGVGGEIGMLGIDFATRRRNRANGRIAGVADDHFTVAVRQSFGNCPQYIQRRVIQPVSNASRDIGPSEVERASLLLVDFENGDLLQLQGTVEIDWSETAGRRFEGAERVWYFRVVRGWRRRGASSVRGTFIDYSPVTLGTGSWASATPGEH